MLYRKATVTRTNEKLIAKYGERAFDGIFSMNGLTSDAQIVSYFAQKMTDEGYQANDYRIDLSTVQIDPATGTAHAVDFII